LEQIRSQAQQGTRDRAADARAETGRQRQGAHSRHGIHNPWDGRAARGERSVHDRLQADVMHDPWSQSPVECYQAPEVREFVARPVAARTAGSG
jgi:hypothetical protein